jgi:hypothetical protein
LVLSGTEATKWLIVPAPDGGGVGGDDDDETTTSVEQLVKCLEGETKVLIENLPHCCLVLRNSHMI